MTGVSKPVVIFCHGSGDCGAGIQRWIQTLVTPAEYNQFDWEFPTAEPIPYSVAGGHISSIWFDRVGGLDPKFPEQTKSVLASVDRLQKVIEAKAADGATRIAIGGFSMGGGIALQTAARSDRITAAFALSSYLCQDAQILANATAKFPPLFMGHGREDDFIKPEWGQATADILKSRTSVDFHLYPNIYHEMNRPEIEDLLLFLRLHLGALPDPNTKDTYCT